MWRWPRPTASARAGLIFKEVMPNLMPWVLAAFVATVAGAILAAVGLEAIGLGANDAHTLGVNIYWAQFYFAMARGYVVVVDPADHHDRLHLHDAVPGLGRDGPLRQPASATRMTPRTRTISTSGTRRTRSGWRP